MSTENQIKPVESSATRIINLIRRLAIWVVVWCVFSIVASREVFTLIFALSLSALLLITVYEVGKLIGDSLNDFYDDLLGRPNEDAESRRRSAW
jgi:hypothetical protein